MDAPAGALEHEIPIQVTEDCPLATRDQTRNLILFAMNTALGYLAAPVTFVIIHAPLCKQYGASTTVANLPSSAYLLTAGMPVLVAWAYPQVALFKRILIISYLSFVAIT